MDFRTWDGLDGSTFGPFGEVCWAQPEVTETEVILQTSECCQAMLAHSGFWANAILNLQAEKP